MIKIEGKMTVKLSGATVAQLIFNGSDVTLWLKYLPYKDKFQNLNSFRLLRLISRRLKRSGLTLTVYENRVKALKIGAGVRSPFEVEVSARWLFAGKGKRKVFF